MGSADELVEEVDREGKVLRVVTRATMRTERLRHRCVFIAVRATDGRVLAHRRSPEKDVWPGYWDLAAGGVVGAGEAPVDAARRELAEELGVDAPLTHLGSGRYDDDDVHVVGEVFEACHDGPFAFADGEVTEARFVTADELHELLVRERVCPDSVALVLPLLELGGAAAPPAR